MGIYKYDYNWNFFKEDTEELYYFLGFVAADGYVSDNEIEIGVNEKDLELLTAFRDLIVPNKPLYYKEKTKAYILKISCKHLTPKIKKFYGMSTNNKHDELCFPDIPKNFIKDFIRGYVDGDGTIGSTKAYKNDKIYNGVRLRILGNKKFLESLNAVTKEFVNHKTNAIAKRSKENIFEVTYNFKTAKQLLIWLYENSRIFLPRKKEKVVDLIALR